MDIPQELNNFLFLIRNIPNKKCKYKSADTHEKWVKDVDCKKSFKQLEKLITRRYDSVYSNQTLSINDYSIFYTKDTLFTNKTLISKPFSDKSVKINLYDYNKLLGNNCYEMKLSFNKSDKLDKPDKHDKSDS